MRLHPLFAAFVALVLALPAPLVPVLAQDAAAEMPPMPRPRPDTDGPSAGAANPGTGDNTPATQAIEALTSVPQPVTLTAKITADSTPIPDGVVWRVFDDQADASGEVALVAKSDEGTAKVELPPGEYVVHVAYGRAQLSEPLQIVPGDNAKEFVLDAGAIRLNSAVTGDIPIPPGLLTFDILTGDESAEQPVAEGLAPNEIVTLNAGTYHVVSHFGSINAVVRADLRVEAGQLTDATLYHHAAQVAFKLVSEAGGEAIADVDWTVQSEDGQTLFTDLGAFPATVLAEGDYVVLAKLGEQVYNREFQVQPGSPREVEVLTTVY